MDHRTIVSFFTCQLVWVNRYDVQVSRLRRLLEQDPAQPRYLQTVWGLGYVFVPDGDGE